MLRTFLLLATLTIHAVAVPPGHWVNSWVAMPQLTEYSNVPNPPFNGTHSIFTNSTIRQTLRTSIAASSYIRIRISNAFGVNDLPITQVGVGLPLNGTAGAPGIVSGSMVPLTFSGNQSIIIPNGAQVVSDPIYYPLEAQSMVTVDLYTEQGQQGFYITSHPGSRTTSWYSSGNYIGAPNMTDPSTQSGNHWFFLSGIEAWSPPEASGWVIIGDSITDGRGSDTNGNNRWPDLVLARMQMNPATAQIAVLNQAAGGNRVLYDDVGPNALGRIERDVLAQPGVRYVMLFEGVNDIGKAPATPEAQRVVGERLVQAYAQIAARVHAVGVPFFMATITPFGARDGQVQPYADPERERTRVWVNDWILGGGGGTLDGVVDFAEVVADPGDMTRLNAAYDSGDGLHPNVAGYQAMADAFPIELFELCTERVLEGSSEVFRRLGLLRRFQGTLP